MADLDIAEYASVYLDTSIYIYFFEDHEQFGALTDNIFSWIIDQKIPLFASELLFTELLVLPMKEQQHELIEVYQSLPTNFPSMRTCPVSREIAVQAAQLRSRYSLRTPDAIHISTAICHNAEIFICSDKELRKVTEIRVECLC